MERSSFPAPAVPPRLQLTLETLSVLALSFACAAFALRPLPRGMDRLLGPGLGDPLFLLVVLKWNLHQFRAGLPDPLAFPIYHPTRDALALSDHMWGPSLAAWPVAAATDPLTAFNALLLAAFVLTGASAFWLFRRVGLSGAAALFGALAFAFSPWRLSQTPHLQMLLIAAVPPLLWFWHRLLRPGGTWRDALGFLAFYGVHVFGGMYLTLMVHVPMAVFLGMHLRSPDGGWKDWWSPRRRRLLAVTAAAALGLLLATAAPYLIQHTGVSLDRGDWSLRTFGATTLSLITPSNFAWYWPWTGPILDDLATGYPRPGRLAEKSLFAGLLPTLLALAGLAAWRRRRGPHVPRASPDRLAWAGAALAAAAFLTADLYTWRVPVPPPPDPASHDVGQVYDACLAALLLGIGFWWWRRRRTRATAGGSPAPRREATFTTGLVLSAVTCLLLAFPVFYEPVADLVPGFDKMRVPARFYGLASLGLTYLAGLGLDTVLGRLRSPAARRGVAAAALVLLAVELAPAPLPLQRVPLEAGFPEVYRWLGSHAEVEAYVSLPFGNDPAGELFPMYYASGHFKPILNGYSGYNPAAYLSLRELLRELPPDETRIDALRRRGATHLLIHVNRLSPEDLARYRPWRGRVLAGEVPGIREVFSGKHKERVYSIVP